jgi:hypothetical protein
LRHDAAEALAVVISAGIQSSISDQMLIPCPTPHREAGKHASNSFNAIAPARSHHGEAMPLHYT